jgi:hypothetical protein
VSLLSYEEARRRFSYDRHTGEFRWKNSDTPWRNGSIAGNAKDGYREVNILGRAYRVHRIIWLMETGTFPPKGLLIDHENGNRSDNRWANLRLATRSQNNHNRHVARSDSLSGIRGVKYLPRRDRYVPILRINGRERKFGYFKNACDAAERFAEIERQYRGENASCLF